MTNEKRIEIEKRVTRKVIKDAIAAGYVVSVNDGEEWVIKRSAAPRKIDAVMFTTSDDSVVLYDADGKRVGMIWLVYGNGADVICDHTDNEAIAAVVAGATALADRLDV